MSFYTWPRDERLDADPGRLSAFEMLRASDELCAWCHEEGCTSRNMGGICPLLEQEADAHELQGQIHGALSGTSRF